MQTRTTYRQLQPEERMTLASMCQARSSVRAMARALERSPSTISREIARNASAEGVYASVPAQALSQTRRIQARAYVFSLPPRAVDGATPSLLPEWGVNFRL
jgi:IS30 family transposase